MLEASSVVACRIAATNRVSPDCIRHASERVTIRPPLTIPFLAALALLVLPPQHTLAQEADQPESEPLSRGQAGLVISLGAGGGSGWMFVGSRSESKGGFIGQLRVGGQTSGGLQILIEADFQPFKVENPLGFEDFRSTYLLGAVQFYLSSPFYLRPGLGVQLRDWGGENPVTDFDTGAALGLSAGYEFLRGDQFTASPELIWRLALIEAEGSVSAMLLGIQVVGTFYP